MKGVEDCDRSRIKDACERGWLAVVIAVEASLTKHGYEEFELHIDRRRMPERLQVSVWRSETRHIQ
jgi:hypothetical protein